jgi:hypothetical protein
MRHIFLLSLMTAFIAGFATNALARNPADLDCKYSLEDTDKDDPNFFHTVETGDITPNIRIKGRLSREIELAPVHAKVGISIGDRDILFSYTVKSPLLNEEGSFYGSRFTQYHAISFVPGQEYPKVYLRCMFLKPDPKPANENAAESSDSSGKGTIDLLKSGVSRVFSSFAPTFSIPE